MGSVGQVPPPGRHEDFLDRLHRNYGVQLVQYLTRMLGKSDLARDVAQDTYEKVHQMYRAEDVNFPRAMLFKVATNTALMRLRRTRLESSLIVGTSPAMNDVADDAARPDKRVIAEETNQQLVQAIQELHPNLREVFVMAYVQGKPRKEIAENLGISLKRVDKRLTRALKDCRERLASLGIDPLRIE